MYIEIFICGGGWNIFVNNVFFLFFLILLLNSILSYTYPSYKDVKSTHSSNKKLNVNIMYGLNWNIFLLLIFYLNFTFQVHIEQLHIEYKNNYKKSPK